MNTQQTAWLQLGPTLLFDSPTCTFDAKSIRSTTGSIAS